MEISSKGVIISVDSGTGVYKVRYEKKIPTS